MVDGTEQARAFAKVESQGDAGADRLKRSCGDFGDAISALKAGDRVARDGWNGKGMWLALTPGSRIPVTNARSGACLALAMAEPVETITILPHIDMRAEDGSIVCGWLASQTDMLAEDWCVVSDGAVEPPRAVGQQDTRSRGEPRVPRHDAPAA